MMYRFESIKSGFIISLIAKFIIYIQIQYQFKLYLV